MDQTPPRGGEASRALAAAQAGVHDSADALTDKRLAEIRGWRDRLGASDRGGIAGPYRALDDAVREIDRLRTELAHERKRVAYWQDSRASYAAENKRLIGEKKQLRAELAAIHAFADRDQDGATCPHNVTGQLRQVLNAKLPKEG